MPCFTAIEPDVPEGASFTEATLIVTAVLKPCLAPPVPVLPPSSSV